MMLKSFKMAKIFEGSAKTIIYLLIFSVPLFFLPWTTNILDFNKQLLLFVLVFVSLLCWFSRSLIFNKIEIKLSFLNFPIIILVLTTALSTIFSLSRYGSFWGWPLIVSSSFLSLLCFVVFYFLIANLFRKDELPFLFFTLFLSGFFVCLFFILQFFGKFILPFDFTRVNSFNTIGTINSLTIFLSLLLILILPFFFWVKKFLKIVAVIFGLLFFTVLLLVNSKIAWLVLVAGMIILFSGGIFHFQKISQINFLPLVMVVLIISLFFLSFRFSLPGLPNIPL